MADNRADEIRQLCAGWRTAATASGGLAIGADTERWRLTANGFAFHDLTYDELRSAIVGLTEILLLPGMNTVVDRDHHLLWAWCAELLVGPDGPLGSESMPELHQLAETTYRAALARVRLPTPTRAAFELARQARAVLDANSQALLDHAHVALAYLAFPLLEAVSRRACAAFVDMNGRVVTPFDHRNGQPYKVGKTCSSIDDLLLLLHAYVASPELAADLNDVMAHVGTLAGEADGFAAVYAWRNSSLHGETSLPTIGGTVLSLASLIAMDELKNDYKSRRAEAVERGRWATQRAVITGRWDPVPWHYYPPYPM